MLAAYGEVGSILRVGNSGRATLTMLIGVYNLYETKPIHCSTVHSALTAR